MIDNGWPAKQGIDKIGRFTYNDPYGQGGSHTKFFLGMLRAHADANSHGRFVNADSWWYRGSTAYSGASTSTALKWDTQGPYASFSRNIDANTRNKSFKYLHNTPMSWCGSDTTANRQNNQEGEPTWTNYQELYRKYGAGGFRVEYNYDGNFLSIAQFGPYAGQNNYTISGRPAAWLPTMSTTDNYSNVAPTVAGTASGSGSTRTITGTASHPLGIHYVKAYVYPSGSEAVATMTWNLGGGSATTNIDNAFMDYSVTVTGASTGAYAIVTAYSIQAQQKSVVVAL
jgi:hypothetical protein